MYHIYTTISLFFNHLKLKASCFIIELVQLRPLKIMKEIQWELEEAKKEGKGIVALSEMCDFVL